MASAIRRMALGTALFVLCGPARVLALVGTTPPIRAVAVVRPPAVTTELEEIVALLAETPAGGHQLLVRTVSKVTGGLASPDLVAMLPDGAAPVDVMFSNAYRPSSVLVLLENLTVLAWDVAFDAGGRPKLVGDTPAILGPFGDPAVAGAGTALAEAPNAADPKSPYLAVGTRTGNLLVATKGLDPVSTNVASAPIDDVGVIPQVGRFAFAAVAGGRLVGVDPDAKPAEPPLDPAVLFSLADPRPDPLVAFSTGVFQPSDEPLTGPGPVSLVAANGTRSVAVLEIPPSPAATGLMKVGIVVVGACPIARVGLGSLVMLTADSGAVLYDPGFTLAAGGSGVTFTIAGAVLDLSPDTLNMKSHGRWIKAVIEVEDGGAARIDRSSLSLHYGADSVAASVDAPPHVGDSDQDGQPDLLARFDRAAVQVMLARAPEGMVTLTARWRYKDGSDGSADAQIRIKKEAVALHPITGEPLSPEELARLDLLRHQFPSNPLLRKALTPAEQADLKRKAAALQEIARKMTAGTAKRKELESYYAYQEKLVQARLELVRFVLAEPQWDVKTRARYQRVLQASSRQLERLAERKQRSLVLLKRKQDAAHQPPAPVVARIEPPQAEVAQGEVAAFQAVAGNAGPIVSLKWTLPTDENAAGPDVKVATKGLRPGLYEVRLDATDASARRSRDTALLQVRPRPAPEVDLAVEAAEAFPLQDQQAGQAELHAVVRNRGQQTVGGAVVRFLLGKQVLHQVDGVALKPGQMQPVSTPPLDAGPLYDHDVVVVIEGPNPETDEDRDNDSVTVAFGPPTPPPSADELGTPGVRFDGPSLPGNGSLSVAPGSLSDIVVETAPLPIDLGPMDGFADLHVHQMANLGFDGRLIWGGYDGPDEEDSLPQCSGMSHALCWLPGLMASTMGFEWEVGSHAGIGYPQVPCLSSPVTGGVGASTKGWASNATSQRFKHWPIWKTVTHQQVFGEWLEAAHEQGLNLIVMSALSARHVCTVMPASNGLLGGSALDSITPAGISNPALDAAIRTAVNCNDMRNVRRQLLAAWQFDADHDWYEIALTPGQAAQIIQEGKLAVVLGIEASELFDGPTTVDEMRAQLDYFVDDLGVRSVQPTHELNDAFGGASFWSPVLALAQGILGAVDAFADLLNGEQEAAAADWGAVAFTRDSVGENTQGLTDLGRQLLLDLMDRNLLIDLAHLAKPGSDAAYSMAVARNDYPLYISHVRYADLLGGNDDPDEDHLAKHWETVQHVKELGGMVGLRTAANRVRTYSRSGVANDCPGSVRDFAQSYTYGALGMFLPQAFASDMNGFIEQMRPRFADPSHPRYGTRAWACGQDVRTSQRRDSQDAQGDWTSDGTGTVFDLTGFGRIDQIGSLLTDLRDNLGVETVQLEDSADAFVQMWERATSSFLRGPGDACIDRSGIVGGPAAGGSTLRPGCPIP